MSKCNNECNECDIGARCGHYIEGTEKYTCPISGPYQLFKYIPAKGNKNENNRNTVPQLQTA